MTKPTTVGDVPDDEAERLAAMYHQAGEVVKASSRMLAAKDPHPSVVGLADAGALTVRETFITCVQGGFMVSYAFAGHEGIHPARGFVQLEPVEHVVGTIATRGNETFVMTETVQDENGRREDVTEARTVIQEVTRWVAHENADPERVGAFFSDLEAKPMYGEFTLADLGDGTWRLEGVPWWTHASSEDVDKADETLFMRLARTP